MERRGPCLNAVESENDCDNCRCLQQHDGSFDWLNVVRGLRGEAAGTEVNYLDITGSG